MLMFKLPRYAVYSVQFSPDARRLLVTTGAPELAVLDALTGQPVWADHSSRVARRAAYAPDGRAIHDIMWHHPWPARLATLDPETGQNRGLVEIAGRAFAVTPDQKHLLCATLGSYSSSGTQLVRSELATGHRLDSLSLEAIAQQVVVSSDGRRAAVRGMQQFAVVDLNAWATLGSLTIRSSNAVVYGTQFAPDGRTVVTSIGPHLRIWDAETGEQLREVRDRGTHVQDLAFTPDGRFLFTASNDATVKVRETATWDVVKSYTWKAGKLRCVTVSPDGTLAAVGRATGRIVVWDVDL